MCVCVCVWCACRYVCMFACAWVCGNVYACGSQRLMSGVFLHHSPPWRLRQGFHITPELAVLVDFIYCLLRRSHLCLPHWYYSRPPVSWSWQTNLLSPNLHQAVYPLSHLPRLTLTILIQQTEIHQSIDLKEQISSSRCLGDRRPRKRNVLLL